MHKGSLQVDKVWDRLACDMSHVGQEKFVTIVGLCCAVPVEIMFGRSVTNPTVRKARGSEHHPEEGGESGHNTERTREYHEGDKVVFKPLNARCDTRWSPGTVTKVNSRWNVDVYGVPRHAQDVRLARPGGGGRQRVGTVPWPAIMINTALGREEPPAAGQDTATTSSEDWDDTVSQQSDKKGEKVCLSPKTSRSTISKKNPRRSKSQRWKIRSKTLHKKK